MVGLLNPIKYGDYFYELYTSSTRRQQQNDRKLLAKRKNKDKKSAAIAAAAALLEGNGAGALLNPIDPPIIKDQLFLPAFPVSHIELDPNASKFAVFSAIRVTVLEAETRFALFHEGGALAAAAVKKWSNTSSACCLVCANTCMLGNMGLRDCSCHAVLAVSDVGNGAHQLEKRLRNDSANSDADSDSDEATEREPRIMATVPLIVGAGLRSLFELIADARHIQPMLCTKALKALLDVIQGQQPESFKQEPDDLINPLYDLLLDLATMPATLLVAGAGGAAGTTASAEANWSATACGALIGLCIARGDTGKMLKAIAAMLMSPRQLSTQIIQLPAVLATLQHTVISAALNKPSRPDFHSNGVPVNSLLEEFALNLPAASNASLLMQPAMTCDGTYIYLLHGGALLKIGTGFGGSYKGHIYAQNEDFTRERNVWLGHSNGQLFFRRNTKRNVDHLQLVNTDTLTSKGMNPMNMLPIREGFNYVLFTDDESLSAICTNRDDSLVVKKLNVGLHNYPTEPTPPPFELPLQLARKKFRTLGYAAFEDEVLNQNQIQKIQSSYNNFEPKLPGDLDVQSIVCGKEFGIVRASNGKVYYYGKSTALGLKSVGRTPTMKLTELIISKAANIVHIALGHDGIHALLVNDDGTVYFTGTSRRGEDGDTSKNRRSPKAVKPKRMSKIDGHVIVHAACNNGTSAFVTKTGKLIMFGKDTAQCDAMGFVVDFIDQHITKVALGKAHCVALNAKGQLFTFGLNNKGQCGRVFNKSAKDAAANLPTTSSTSSSAVSAASSTTTIATSPAVAVSMPNSLGECVPNGDRGRRIKFDFSTLCDYDDHSLVQGQCRVCVVCRECTGYNVSCVSALNVPNEDRLAGSVCPCGHGDAGCVKCGLCAACISLQEVEAMDIKDLNKLPIEMHRPRSKTLIMRRREKKPLEDNNTNIDFDKDPPRVAPLGPQLLSLPSQSPVVQIACGLHHTVVLTLAGEVFTFGSNQFGQLGTGDLQAVNGPVKVQVQGAINQVSAGCNHTVLMTHKGMVYTFGNYQKGQLGRLPNDVNPKTSAGGDTEEFKFPSVKLAVDLVLPCGSKDATASAAAILAQRQKFLWHCTPGAVSGLGPSFGKKVTWIGASGDETFIKIDESLVTAQMLPKMHVVANRKTILLIPTIPLSYHTLSINRRDGSCTAHQRNQINFVQIIQSNKANAQPEVNQNIDMVTPVVELASGASTPPAAAGSAGPINEQMSRSMHEARNQIFEVHHQQEHVDLQQQLQQAVPPVAQQRRRQRRQAEQCAAGGAAAAASSVTEKPQPQIAFAMDPHYNVLWVFDGAAKKLRCHNVLNNEINTDCGVNSANYSALLSPELALPSKCDARISRSQASLNLLACLDILTSAQDNIPACFEEALPKQPSQNIEAQNNEYQVVNRFDNFGGGWGYSGHSVEAVRFSADTDVMIVGFGIFGGRGEYTCKVRLYDMGVDGGGYEKDGVLVSETKEIPFECAARSKHHILLPKPVNAPAGRWFLVWARVSGPSSDCGSCGQASVTTEDQVVFTFKSSKKANNGTDVNSGQIPAVLYRLISQESKQQPAPIDAEPVQKISKAFANSVTKECFESLVVLLSWSWESFKTNIRDQREKSGQLQVKQSLEYLSYVNKSCLRLLRKYTNEIYPQRATAVAAPVPSTSSTTHSSNIAAALSKLHSQNKLICTVASSSKGGVYEANKGAIRAVGNNAGNILIAHNVAKYFSEAVLSAASCSTSVIDTPVARKPNLENIQLAECIGNVRALLIGIFCDDIFKDVCTDEGYTMVLETLNECHLSFVACFDAFYPTSTLKWNCLCDLLAQMDKGALHSRLLSAILAGLCSPSVKLRSTFSLLNAGNERQSIISPSDNSGLPMLSSTEAHQYPILVEQMIYRTQQEKSDFIGNCWTFKDVLVRLLEIIANPIRAKIELIYNRTLSFNCSAAGTGLGKDGINQGLIDNCCHLLARVLAEIVYQTSLGEYDKMFLPPRTLHSTGSRFSRCDLSRTWNTGNFGPDAIAFSVDRAGIAIAGAMVYSGSGSYDYQLELLFDNTGDLQPQHKWETLESITGSYDQDLVHNDMAELKFEHPVHIKEHARYALRLCSQGSRTCSGDAGIPSIRGPCGAVFHFYSCDLSFNGTTPQRGQIPCVLYYSTPVKHDSSIGGCAGGSGGAMSGGGGAYTAAEVSTRDTALQIASDITKKCTELLILARNALAASSSPSDNSSNHTQTIDSEHNITPIEEHMDINWANNSRTSVLPVDPNISTARDQITKRIESFSKGIMETLKFDKRSTNPFEMEIEIGATEIGIEETPAVQIAKLNGNERTEDEVAEEIVQTRQQHQQAFLHGRSDSEEAPPATTQFALVQLLEVFNLASSNMFHTLLPLVYAHIANLACSDPKSSVQILGLIKEILPHIAALNQLFVTEDRNGATAAMAQEMRHFAMNFLPHKQGEQQLPAAAAAHAQAQAQAQPSNTCTTSNHYCVVESEHPYRSATISCYRVEFPPCVQWLTIEFDSQCGTAQMEDYLLLSIPVQGMLTAPSQSNAGCCDKLEQTVSTQHAATGASSAKNAHLTMTSCYNSRAGIGNAAAAASAGAGAGGGSGGGAGGDGGGGGGDGGAGHARAQDSNEREWIVVKKFNTAGNWMQNVLILPGNSVEFSLETSSLYAQDPHNNRYGFKCLVVGYDNPTAVNTSNSCLIHLEQELAYLGGMCSANLMKKDLNLPDDKDIDDLTGIEETISAHHALLSKGFALAEPALTVHQALESYLSIGSQSNERQFLKDFISGAPGSSGARLAAWLQPESRLDPNKCELNTITEPLRYGWPTQVTVTIRDQYGDAVLVPELKVEIKAIPTGSSGNGNIKMRRASCTDHSYFGGVVPPPRLNYEATTKEKMCFKAITFMKPYTNYSFEELRYSSPVQTRITETLYAQDMEDGTFSVHWTPNSVGSYCLTVTIDGIPLEEVYRVEVKEGVLPPPSHKYTVKKPQAPNKLRKFFVRHSAGLRIRSHPTMQSEQVGVIKLNGVISFIDEIENDDGIWLRLSTESIRQHCTMGWYPTEAWCLQYNQHLAKPLLLPVLEPTCATTSTTNTTVTTTVAATTTTLTGAFATAAVAAAPSGTRGRHKVLLDNIDIGAGGIESPTSTSASTSGLSSRPKSDSPHKKIFDFSYAARAAPLKTSDSVRSAVSTNPFLFPNLDAKADMELLDDSELKHVFDCPTAASAALPATSASTATTSTTVHADLLSLHTLQNTSPANIGSAIAGVVGGGASKLQALQKWFKGDTIDGSNPSVLPPVSMRDGHQRKRSDVSEIASVSVRELVRVMGGQQEPPQRGNGNSGSQSRSSPVQIPHTCGVDSSGHSGSVKSVEASEASTGLFSSLTQDSSQHSVRSLKQESQIDSYSQTEFDVGAMRKMNFTPSQAVALLSTPKRSPRRHMTAFRRTNSPTSSSVEAIKDSDLSNLEDEMSLLQITTTTTAGNAEQNELLFGDSKTGSTTASTDNSSPPVWPTPINAAGPFCQKAGQSSAPTASPSVSSTKRTTIGPIKRAMPPSFAESIRAVFAAFLWHEGIVHDAMACASFLKFHPSLPKEGATVVTRRDSSDARLHLSREQKAQQRHSVEVANAGNYLNIRPSTLETLTKSGNSSLNNRIKYRKNQQSDAGIGLTDSAGGDKQKLQAFPEVVTVLPPALRCLVYLWEQICANCVQIVQSNTFEREKLSSPSSSRDACLDAKEKCNDFGIGEKEALRKTKRKKKDDGSWCEICEVYLPIPVTYHMRIAHPGCGKSAKGKGYNSVGIFCEGWAGNCGEGGKGASSWFLMCDICRDKYLTANKTMNNVNNAPSSSSIGVHEMNLFGMKTATLLANSEVYTTMRENATFLLELCSSVSNLPSGGAVGAASSSSLGGTSSVLNTSGTKRSPQQMPVVIEHQHFNIADLNKPSTSRVDSARNSRVGLRMSGKFSGSTPFRKSFVGVPPSTPDNVWIASDTFACLDCLGTQPHEDLPYEMFGVNTAENGHERPLSEISYESCDPNNYDAMTGSMGNTAQQGGTSTGTLGKFHRSFSMGQGWAAAQQQQPLVNYKMYAAGGAGGMSGLASGGLGAGNIDESQHPKVVFRRRNNSTSEGEGSLLICYPSENLRRLVPDKVLTCAVVHAAVQRVATETTVPVDFMDAKIPPARGNANDQLGCDYEQPSSTAQNKDLLQGQLPTTPPPHLGSPVAPDLVSSQLNLLLARPAMAFITQKHDLDKLRYAMKRSLRIAACRIYSLQALNWLVRAVTQSVCLHDLMWWFVSSLSISSVEMVDGKYEDVEPALEHPVSYTQISGRFSHLITQSLHVFLQSVADLTLHLPLGSPLQRIAIQCFGIRFRQADHQFLHSSHVFGNISKILSKSDEQNDAMAVSTMLATSKADYAATLSNAHCDAEQNFSAAGVAPSAAPGAGAKIVYYTDLNGMFEVTVSSRQAMAESLTDNSTETFWESDEEDRNKCKIIEVSMTKLSYAVKCVLVHIDNSRDIQNKVLNVVFYAGQCLGDTSLIKSVDVDQKACTWISAKISDESYTHFRLEFHGPENTLRVRQIKLLGLPSLLNPLSGDDMLPGDNVGLAGNAGALGSAPNMVATGQHKSNLKLTHATRIQQQICEAETLRVFRLITGQVFGKLISNAASNDAGRLSGGIGGGGSGLDDSRHQQSSMLGMDSSANSMLADSLDLREHMVGILFSRSKLSHLQKQVIVHIVHAIKKEAQRAKEDWELVNLTNVFKDTVSARVQSAAAAAGVGSGGSAGNGGGGEAKSESSSERFRAPDTYCFEMLSMVLALSGSVVGRSYLSHQYGLLKDLLSLLHTGSDRVQRQVTALLRRILPEITPESFAELLGVQKLPPPDYNIAHHNASDFDMNRLGLLDIFLAVVAKSLQLQVKVKTNASKSNTEKSPAFLRLYNSLDLSVHLLKPCRSAEEQTSAAAASANAAASNSADPFRFDQPTGGDAGHMTVDYGMGRSTLKSSKKETKKNLNQRWFLNGTISMKQAESIINLIRDLASGKLSEKWSQMTKAAIAESVLNLTRLDEVFRTPENCIKTATLWLALASLCVLERDHVEKLSSGQWSKVSDTRPMCTNHDDGETAAIIQCETCGSLCADCDRYLHLNRKTRTHKRTVCKEEEEAIRVELHESCGRTKLFWLLALADSKTLKAMVEFRDGSHTIISGPQEAFGRCRFCGITGNSGLLEIGNVCADAQCQEYAANSCMKIKPCGHACGGVTNEKKCLPCLQHVCHTRENESAEEFHEPKLTQDADDMCMVCFVEALSCAPSIHLECGHVFHYHCCKAVLEKRWSGPRITFGFSLCPICKADIQHPLLGEILEPINALKQDVKRKALMRIKYEGVVKETDTKDVTQIAMDRYAYYVCFKCQKAYYGGEARCDAEIGDKFDPEELVCGGCSDVARAQMCPKHGTDFLEYKCRYCCSVAVFFCFGTTHFCDTCHDDFQRLTNIPKTKLPQCPAGPKAKQLLGDECPLHVIHPPTGEEFALGCGVCRNAQTF